MKAVDGSTEKDTEPVLFPGSRLIQRWKGLFYLTELEDGTRKAFFEPELGRREQGLRMGLLQSTEDLAFMRMYWVLLSLSIPEFLAEAKVPAADALIPDNIHDPDCINRKLAIRNELSMGAFRLMFLNFLRDFLGHEELSAIGSVDPQKAVVAANLLKARFAQLIDAITNISRPTSRSNTKVIYTEGGPRPRAWLALNCTLVLVQEHGRLPCKEDVIKAMEAWGAPSVSKALSAKTFKEAGLSELPRKPNW